MSSDLPFFGGIAMYLVSMKFGLITGVKNSLYRVLSPNLKSCSLGFARLISVVFSRIDIIGSRQLMR